MNKGSKWQKWDLHVHTASSYDHKYKNEESDELLVKAWEENEISVVAITDHFIIDAERIKRLRKLAPKIHILPGVELRIDKGSTNLHIILIFPDQNIDEIASRYKYNLLDLAKHKDNNDKIYWDYNDIISFARKNNAIITIHAGKKANGIDKEIVNSLKASIATKEEIANDIDIFELGRIKDIDDYNNHVFKSIQRKPLIICSDNHDPRDYKIKQNLWIKAEPNFQGLMQALEEPELRFFIGKLPHKEEVVNNNMDKFIDSIEIKGYDSQNKWFNNKIELNYDLVSIIGNKGNGKSALADIISHGGNTYNYEYFSFLNRDRFNENSNHLGNKYTVKIKWKHGVEEEKKLALGVDTFKKEKVRYLPQKYIEEVCNDLKDKFKKEIERLIFDYIPEEEKLKEETLENLVNKLLKKKTEEFKGNINKLKEINLEIINKQELSSESELTKIKLLLNDYEEQIEYHQKNKPAEVVKPNIDPETEKRLNQINLEIEELSEKIEVKNDNLKELNLKKNIIESAIENVIQAEDIFKNKIEEQNNYLDDNKIEETIKFEMNIDYKTIRNLKANITNEISLIKKEVSTIDDNELDGSLIKSLKEKEYKAKNIIDDLSHEQVKYQNYLLDMNKWVEKTESLTLKSNKMREKIRVIEEDIPKEIKKISNARKKTVEKIYEHKKYIKQIYEKSYSYVNNKINELNINQDEKPSIDTSFNLDIEKLEIKLFNNINQNIKSIFRGKEQAKIELKNLLQNINIYDFEVLFKYLTNIEEELYKSIEEEEKVFKDKLEFFNSLYNLDYIDIKYELKLGDKTLNKLSPGEKGLLLLIFYLMLDKDNMPLIIDQPEDNLDNESIYNKLVRYIIKAKEKRQIIIVTHNPNIAIACDSEQIIYSNMDKDKLEIRYESGSIESKNMNKHIVNVLEGTMPAFNKRSTRYIQL